MTTQDGTVTITLKDVYLAVQDVQKTVAPLPGYGAQILDHENRIRALEKWRYGHAAVFGISVSSLATALAAIFTHR